MTDKCTSGCSRIHKCGITLEDSKYCPCAECLVKASCGQVCDDRQNYYNVLHLDVRHWKLEYE